MPKSAQALSKAALFAHHVLTASNVPYVVVGGAAMTLMGGTRLTNDVDISVKHLGDSKNKFIADGVNEGIRIQFDKNLDLGYRVAGPPNSELPKVDVKPRPTFWPIIEGFIQHTPEGIAHVDERLMVVMKIASIANRGSQSDQKIKNDIIDLVFVLGKVKKSKRRIPPEIQAIFLPNPDEMWETFWSRVGDQNKETLEIFFTAVGIAFQSELE